MGWGILQAEQIGRLSLPCKQPPLNHTQRLTAGSVLKPPLAAKLGGLPWPICKSSSLPQAEQKRGNVDSQNPGSNLHLAGPGETPTRPRLNRDQAQPFECQVGN